MKNYLEFEKEIKALEQDVDGLKSPFGSEGISEVDTQKIKNTQNEINEKLKETYANLNSWQKTQVARHEDRPKANFYIKKIFSKFTLLSGDRYFGDDKSVIAGFGLIDDKSVLVIGQEKGEDLNSRIERNFGMMRPEGYRKCIRLMKLADRFKIPVISFIDTPGAYPGLGAEQRGQASAIANSIECCMSLTVPNISIIIGERQLFKGCIDSYDSEIFFRIVRDQHDLCTFAPLGFENFSKEEIYDHRKAKFLQIGRDQGFSKSTNLDGGGLSYKDSNFKKLLLHLEKNKLIYGGLSVLAITSLIVLLF